jgi:hypothetical protein
MRKVDWNFTVISIRQHFLVVIVANIHYVHSACQGTPMLLSSTQISHLCKKKAASSKVGTPSGIITGETDDIYMFLEQSSN